MRDPYIVTYLCIYAGRLRRKLAVLNTLTFSCTAGNEFHIFTHDDQIVFSMDIFSAQGLSLRAINNASFTVKKSCIFKNLITSSPRKR